MGKYRELDLLAPGAARGDLENRPEQGTSVRLLVPAAAFWSTPF